MNAALIAIGRSLVALDILSSLGKGVADRVQSTVSSGVEGIAKQGTKAALTSATNKNRCSKKSAASDRLRY